MSLETSEGSFTDDFVDFDDLVEGIEPGELDTDFIEDVAVETLDASQTFEPFDPESEVDEATYEKEVLGIVDPSVTPAKAPVVKAETKMDVARRIFAEEVQKALPNKQVRKTVIDRFIAEAGFGIPYAGTAYQNITKENK